MTPDRLWAERVIMRALLTQPEDLPLDELTKASFEHPDHHFFYELWTGLRAQRGDSGFPQPEEVQQACVALGEEAEKAFCRLGEIILLKTGEAKAQGLDLKAALRILREERKPAPPDIALIDPPRAIERLLQLIDGHGYAVTWPWVRLTKTESLDPKTGQIITHCPPILEKKKCLLVIRDDGVSFGDGAERPLSELGFEVNIGITPRGTKMWSIHGIKAYLADNGPDPQDVFRRLTAIIDRFMSFDRSLAPQEVMTEFIACYALSTWFLDAFDVVGFLWPSGGYGTGKTKLGLLVCEVAYLGEALLSGSTYACLRDLADLGATLLFDDAENLADPKHKDPDKRNLLLAGNRKGTVVAVKEADGKGIWRTRYVNAYCPRLFTATKLPDAILASRTIVIPLVRTADPKKANADVLDFRLWPHDRRKLLDDLWAVALGNLAQMPAHLAAVNEDAPLLGRNLEPWKATLAVAHWLDHRGEGGLYERMRSLAQSYQTDQIQLAVPDLTTIIARAIIQKVCHECHYSISAINSETYSDFTTEDISEEVKRLIKGEDIDLDLDYITSRRVGRALGKLRLTQLPRAGGKGSRKWRISASQLEQLSRSYAVPTPTQLNGTNGIMALMAQVEPTPVGEVLQ